ncbi:MAG: biotin--[acetyl-CoA-carboxylase] ligase [Erysipelotrichales bacterium]
MKRIRFKEIDSTALYALRNIDNFNEDTLISAEYQSNGIGSKKRDYISYNECGLYLNLILVDGCKQNIMFIVSVALVEVLRKYNKNINIKWINDLMYQDKKVGGILVHQKNNKLSIGIGLNLYEPTKGYGSLNSKVTYLFKKEINKDILISEIISTIYFYINTKEDVKSKYLDYARLEKDIIKVNNEVVEFISLQDDGRILVGDRNTTYLVDDIRYDVRVGDYYEN